MSFTDVIDRTGAGALIPEDVQRDIVKGTIAKSAVLSLFRHRRMTRAQQRMPVLSLKPTAYFVSGDTGLKKTTEMAWTNKYLDAEEIAVIVPIPEKLLDDVDYDIWDEVRPEVEEAIAVALDDAVLFGVNKPTSWPTDIKAAAIAAANRVIRGTNVDFAADVSEMMRTVENDGYAVNGFVGRPDVKGRLRGLRDTQNRPLLDLEGVADTAFKGRLWGERLMINEAGLTGFASGSGNGEVIGGDWRQGIVGIRQDITMKILTEAVIQDDTGATIWNLPQQDMVAARFVARYAWQVPNPPNRTQTTEASRYPFGIVTQP